MKRPTGAELAAMSDADFGAFIRKSGIHTISDCRSAIEAWEAEQPAYLGCGCLAGTHDNTIEALHEAHPDVLGWEYRGPFYGRAIG